MIKKIYGWVKRSMNEVVSQRSRYQYNIKL